MREPHAPTQNCKSACGTSVSGWSWSLVYLAVWQNDNHCRKVRPWITCELGIVMRNRSWRGTPGRRAWRASTRIPRRIRSINAAEIKETIMGEIKAPGAKCAGSGNKRVPGERRRPRERGSGECERPRERGRPGERGRRRTRQDQISRWALGPVKLRSKDSAPNEENLFLLPDRLWKSELPPSTIQPFDLMSRRHPLSSTRANRVRFASWGRSAEGSCDVPASSRRQFSQRRELTSSSWRPCGSSSQSSSLRSSPSLPS